MNRIRRLHAVSRPFAALAAAVLAVPSALAVGCSSDNPPSPPEPSRPPVTPGAEPGVLLKADLATRYLRQAPVERLQALSRMWNIAFEENGEPRFNVMVKLSPRATLESSDDVRVGAQMGSIVSVYPTRAGLDLLDAHPAVQRIEAMRRMNLANDISTTSSSIIARPSGTPATEFALPITGLGSITVPFTAPVTPTPIQFRLSKMGQNDTGGTLTTVNFNSSIAVCQAPPINNLCPLTPAAAATANGPGGDAVTAPTTFAAAEPLYVILSGVGAPGPGQPASVNVALTVVGDATQGFDLGSKARSSGRNGANVIFADIDTGIDFCHPDFITANGASRILYLWDQSLTPTGTEHSPPEAEFAAVGGVEYTQADIQASLASCGTGNPTPVRSRDVDAHGTHTAGTAVGGGGNGATATPYIGAAPDASIIVVKGLGTGVTQQHLAESVQYALVRARGRGQPVAINGSWGSYGDEADGLTLFEQQVSSVAGQGSVAVFSAGNTGGVPSHATSTMPPASTGTADTFYLLQSTCNPGAATPTAPECAARPISFWTDPKDAYTVTLTDAGGNTATWTSCDLAALPSGTTRTLGDATTGGTVSIVGQSSLAPGGQHLFFDIPAATTAISTRAFWTITITRESGSTGSAKWDAYLTEDGLSGSIIPYDSTALPTPPNPPPSQRHVTHLANASDTTGFLASTYTPGQLTTPATGLGVISVGAITGNVRWLDNSTATGGYTEPSDAYLNFNALGNLAYLSARGPSRDGRALPIVAAPGMHVVSSASEFAASGVIPATDLVFNAAAPGTTSGAQHAVFSGTSMSAAGVAGVAALILQTDNQNFPRPLIRHTAAQDALTQEATATTGVPVQGWNGAGKVDAVAAINALTANPARPTATGFTLSSTTPTAGAPLTMSVTASATAPATVEEYLWDIDGDGYIDVFTNSSQTMPNQITVTTPDVDGFFHPKVTVVDSNGRTAVAQGAYTISGAFDAGAPDGGAGPLCIPPPDAGNDSGMGSGSDSGVADAGNDSGMGSGSDAGVADAGNDSGMGSGSDSGVADAGNDSGESDAGQNDAGMAMNDAGQNDAGMAMNDAGQTDAGMAMNDAGQNDAGMAMNDAGQNDAGMAMNDAGEDSGAVADAGSPGTDGGVKDAGGPGTDAGGRIIDGGGPILGRDGGREVGDADSASGGCGCKVAGGTDNETFVAPSAGLAGVFLLGLRLRRRRSGR